MLAAVDFLSRHGTRSLVSLGCGEVLNRIDNHVRLFATLELQYYVGVDCVPCILLDPDALFAHPEEARAILGAIYGGTWERFLDALRLFPQTWAEELRGVRCRAVVCQRVPPFVHWESILGSMRPDWILQEDFHGCERQDLRRCGYEKSRTAARRLGLKPFRPWKILPGERNLALWKRKGLQHRPRASVP